MTRAAVWVLLALALHSAGAPASARAAGDAAAPPPLAGTTWRLVELAGKPVAPAEGEAPRLLLKDAGRQLEGFGGCNSISGSYELREGARISFTGVASTMRACPDMELEAGFFRALEVTDGYAIGEGRLSLLQGQAPLARFEAAPAP